MAITFDPVNRRVILDSTYVEAIDLYSRWKEWVQTGDNSKWLPAFSTVGGDSLGGGIFVSQYFFLENGWRIRPMESDHSLVIEGNLGVAGGGYPVVPTLGSFRVLVQLTVPVQAQAIDTGGGSGSTPAEIASAVRSELAPELAKIDEMEFTVPNRLDVNILSIKSKPVKMWNGLAWV